MLKFETKLKGSTGTVPLTPMVDVVFLLLVFFVVGSNILPLKSLLAVPPEVKRDSTPLTSQIVVIMKKDRLIYLGPTKDMVDFANLSERLEQEITRLKQRDPRRYPTIVLNVDGSVPYGDFLRLFSVIQECGNPVRLVYQSDAKWVAQAKT